MLSRPLLTWVISCLTDCVTHRWRTGVTVTGLITLVAIAAVEDFFIVCGALSPA